MISSNSKSLGNHVVSPEEEKEKAAVGRIYRKRLHSSLYERTHEDFRFPEIGRQSWDVRSCDFGAHRLDHVTRTSFSRRATEYQ